MWIPLPPPYSGPEVASALLADECRALLQDVVIENASIRTTNMQRGKVDAAGLSSFARALRRFARAAAMVDIVYLVVANSAVGAVRDAVLIGVARRLGKRVVIHLRGGNYAAFYARQNAAMKRLLRWTWGSAQTAIVQTTGLRSALREAAPHVAIQVVPNGLRGHQFATKPDYRLRGPRILFVGHLTYHKGFTDLLAAFAVLRTRWPDAVLSCAGELPDPVLRHSDFLPRGHRENFVRDRSAICAAIRAAVALPGNGVEYAGVVTGEEKAALSEAADVFVLPSYTEGFSVALLEAMFHGLPIVTTRTGGSPDIVRHEENGLLVEAGDVPALIAAIERLVGDQRLRETMGRRNAQEARERYDIHAVARQLASVFANVAAR